MNNRLSILPNARRLIITSGFALAAVIPMIIGAAPHGAPAALAACPNGEQNDSFTEACIPYLVPNSPIAAPAAAPAPAANLCPPGVTGGECAGDTGIQPNPAQNQLPAPITPQQPEQELQDVSTPDY